MLLVGVWWLAKQNAARERAQWTGPALAQLALLSITNEAIRRELADEDSDERMSMNLR